MEEEEKNADLQGNVRKDDESKEFQVCLYTCMYVYMYVCVLSSIHLHTHTRTQIYCTTKWNHLAQVLRFNLILNMA